MTITTVFTHNQTQAVRLPADSRFPENIKKVDVRVRGHERIISPVDQAWDSFILNGPVVSEDFMMTRATQEQSKILPVALKCFPTRPKRANIMVPFERFWRSVGR